MNLNKDIGLFLSSLSSSSFLIYCLLLTATGHGVHIVFFTYYLLQLQGLITESLVKIHRCIGKIRFWGRSSLYIISQFIYTGFFLSFCPQMIQSALSKFLTDFFLLWTLYIVRILFHLTSYVISQILTEFSEKHRFSANLCWKTETFIPMLILQTFVLLLIHVRIFSFIPRSLGS